MTFCVIIGIVFIIALLISYILVRGASTSNSFEEVYKQEKKAARFLNELTEQEKEDVVARVKANYPDEVNEKILSETLNYRKRQLEGLEEVKDK